MRVGRGVGRSGAEGRGRGKRGRVAEKEAEKGGKGGRETAKEGEDCFGDGNGTTTSGKYPEFF